MSNFRRAIQLTLRHRLTVVGVLLTSAMVALFWAASITAVYPVFEVTLQSKSMHEWADESIQKAKDNCKEIRANIRQLEAELGAATTTKQQQRIRGKIRYQKHRLAAEQKAIATTTRLQPFIRKYLPDDAFQTLILIVVFLLTGTMIKGVFLVANMMLVQRLSERISFHLRNDFFQHILQMELGAFGKGRSSDLMSRVAGDVGAIGAAVAFLFGKAVREPMKAVTCIIGAALISWRLLLFSLLVTPIAIFVMYCLGKSIKRANRRVMEEMSRLFGRLSQSFTGIQVVKAYTMERAEVSRFYQTAHELYRRMMRITMYESFTRLNNEMLGVGVICLAMLAGGYLVITESTHLLGIPMTDRALDFGSVMLFFAFLAGVSDPVRKLADLVNVVQRGSAAADRVYPLLDQQPEIKDPPNPRPLKELRKDLVFDRVSFHYVKGQPILQDICLRIPFGETLAIVGPNGCGKSTLINLLPRFYDPVEGTVRIGNVDLREASQVDLRGHMGIVTQQTVLFDESVMSNIRYGSPNASDSDVIAAAKQARAHSFITENLENGYHTQVGEHGGRLSGGQRQRIALARAFLRDPSLLILDEATSQVDPESELLIHKALEDFAKGRTTIMITHRMSTLDLADRILVMDAGRIVDMGTHEQLIARCDLFQRLYQIAFRESA